MESIIKKSFSLNLTLMKIVGLYPPEKPTRFYKVRAYVMFVLCAIPIPLLGFIRLLHGETMDKMELNYNATFVTQTTFFITKFLPFIRNGAQIRRCIDYFESPFFAVYRDNHKKIIDDCIGICRRNSLVFFGAVVVCITSWSIRPLLLEDYRMPIDVWLPFDTTTPNKFYPAYLFITVGATYLSFVTSVIDPLLAGLASHAAAQLKILKNNLQHLNKYSRSQTTYDKIKRCVDHHNAIIRFAEEYEECFSSVIFSQLVASVFVLSFICLTMGKLKTLDFYFGEILFYVVVLVTQIYFYCYYGTTLFEESNSLTSAIYMGEWYEFDVKSRRALITIMERSRRPIIITTGKILELSLTTLSTILRRSYSLLALLQNYQ